MLKFNKFGFRRLTHKEGVFDKSYVNAWQLHIWNTTLSGHVGLYIPTQKAISFEKIVEESKDKWKEEIELDTEEIALALIELINCGLISIEPIEDYETDIYDCGIKFWKQGE
jgi:hypothetical protein